jgi:hypothetical protein
MDSGLDYVQDVIRKTPDGLWIAAVEYKWK